LFLGENIKMCYLAPKKPTSSQLCSRQIQQPPHSNSTTSQNETPPPPPVHCAQASAQNGPKSPIMGGAIRGGVVIKRANGGNALTGPKTGGGHVRKRVEWGPPNFWKRGLAYYGIMWHSPQPIVSGRHSGGGLVCPATGSERGPLPATVQRRPVST